MTWVKLDDHLHAHPKVLKAWGRCSAALGLHMLALTHSGAYSTDGHVPEEFVKRHLPGRSQRDRAVGALLESGLWEPAQGGWQIHDYLDYNESRREIRARRRQAPSRARAGAAAGAPARSRVPARPTPDLFPNPAS